MTTEEPVLSTALVIKDLFEYKSTSFIFDLLKGWGITFAGHVMPNVINEASSNNFWRYLFNFDFFIFFEKFEYTNNRFNFNITPN